MEKSHIEVEREIGTALTEEIDLTKESSQIPVQDSAPQARKIRPAVRHRPGDSKRLRQIIVGVDVLSAIFAWTVGFIFNKSFSDITFNPISYFVGSLAFISSVFSLCVVLSLYRTKISFVPSVERGRILAVGIGSGLFAGLILSGLSQSHSIQFSIVTGLAFFAVNSLARSLFRHWLRIQRAHGRFHREILLIGTNSDAQAMYELLRTHQEVGFTIVGVVGNKDESQAFSDIAWCGSIDEIVESVRKTGATGVVIAANALDPTQLRHVTNRLLSRSIHVHVSSGLFGFDERRIRPQNFSREPVFYVEPISFPILQRGIKRLFDIVFSALLLVLFSPILAVSALLIKLNDSGPVFFHQTRIGKDGLSFRCVKLRTMSVGAERNLEKVMKQNERHGPLFKHSNDPRRTKVGRILEATSLDEVPQLWLVLKGEMSLIGPRPALPHEVAVFDDELNARHLVRPGITGLWQVESRDNPSFDAYKRLDLFYVENWSLLLDISIIAMTFHVVFSRAMKTIFSRKRPSWARSGVSDPGNENL